MTDDRLRIDVPDDDAPEIRCGFCGARLTAELSITTWSGQGVAPRYVVPDHPEDGIPPVTPAALVKRCQGAGQVVIS